MVGLSFLANIDRRLRELKPLKNHLPFGGVSIILMGDFAQLPPVADKTMYQTGRMSIVQARAADLYRLFKLSIVFDEIVRQQGPEEAEFRDILSKLTTGHFSVKEWESLKKQNLSSMPEDQQAEFKNNAVMLCALNKDLRPHNIFRMQQLGQPIAPIKAKNSCSKAAKAEPTTACGLPKSTILAKGAQMMITTNLWSETGLTNGAKCTVRYIVYSDDRCPPMLPDVVLVHVPQYVGPAFLQSDPKLIPIVPLQRSWPEGSKTLVRTMIPLTPAYAISIHKSQGMSLDMVMINLGDREFALGLTYTAISRCKKLQSLAFDPFPDFMRFKKIFDSGSFHERRKEDARLSLLEVETLKSLSL